MKFTFKKGEQKAIPTKKNRVSFIKLGYTSQCIGHLSASDCDLCKDVCPSLCLGMLLARGPRTGLQLHVRPDMRFLWRNIQHNLRKCFLEPHTAGGSGSLQLLWRLGIPRWHPNARPGQDCERGGQGARMGAPRERTCLLPAVCSGKHSYLPSQGQP